MYAFWAGRPDGARAGRRRRAPACPRRRRETPADLARAYLAESPERQALGARYLRDIIKYDLGDDERAGLETFYRYAAEIGIVDKASDAHVLR